MIEPPTCSSVPFRRHEAGYSHFRIPAIIRTTGGMLLAFAEARADHGGDSGNIDLVLRRSLDRGCTWGRLIVVADHGRNTIGNPAPVYDTVTKQVVVLATGNGGRMTGRAIASGRATAATTRRVFRLTSSNDGITWSRKDLTRMVKPRSWRWYATGPGHAIQIHGGPYNGRLVVTGDHSSQPAVGDLGTERKYLGSHSLTSDDHGATWQLGYVDDSYDGWLNTNETSVAQLLDGRIYFNTRDQFGAAPGTRAFAYSRTGGSSLAEDFEIAPFLPAPVVQASVLGLGATLYFAGPATTDGTRRRMTLRSSPDGGESGLFASEYVIWNGYAAYSDLVPTSTTTIGVLYERGLSSPYDEIAFRSVSTSQLATTAPTAP